MNIFNQSWLWIALASMICWGVAGVTQKMSTNYISAQLSFLGFSFAFLPIAVVSTLIFPFDTSITWGVIILGCLGGALNGLGALTSFAAFELGGKASVVIPVISLYPLITVIGSRFFFNEHISYLHWAGIVLSPIAAWLLSCDESMS